MTCGAPLVTLKVVPSAAGDGGLGAFVHRVEGFEMGDGVTLQDIGVLEATEHRAVDRVVVVRAGGQRAVQDDGRGRDAVDAERGAQRQRVLGQGAGLVRAEHVDAGEFLDGDQPAHDGLLLGEQPCADSHRHRQHGGHRHRDRGDGQDQGELQRGQDRVAAQDRRDDDNGDQRDREDDQIVADLQHGALEMADGVRVGHQLGGLAEVRVRAGGIDKGADLTLPDNGSGEHGVAC